MALTPGRWLAALVVMILALSTLVADSGEEVTSTAASARPVPALRQIQRDRERLAEATSFAVERLRTLQILDSLDAARPIRLDERGGIVAPTVVITDTGSIVAGRTRRPWERVYAEHVLPSATSDGSCLTMIRITRTQLQAWESARAVSDASEDAGKGICRFYATFGMPGPGVRAWVEHAGARLGASANWEVGTRPLRESNSWEGNLLRKARKLDLRQVLPIEGVRCAGGNERECVNLLMSGGGHAATWGGGIVANRRTVRLEAMRETQGFGLLQNTLLADMARTLGPEKFRAFWASPLEPAEAFRAATGTDLGAWLVGWMRRAYWREPVGPTTSRASIAGGSLSILLFVGLAMLVAMRRRVGG